MDPLCADHPNRVPAEDFPSIAVHGVNGSPKGDPRPRHDSSAFDAGWPPPAAAGDRRARYEAGSDGDTASHGDYGRREISRGQSTDSHSNAGARYSLSIISGDGKKFALDVASVDPQNAPGIKMAKTSTGQRLKRSASYQKRLSVNGHPSIPASGTTTGAELGDDAVSLTSNALTDDLGRRPRKRTFLEYVPLFVQVCTVMMVPIIFLTTYLGISLSSANKELSFLRDNNALIRGIIRCEYEVLIERARNSQYLAENDPEKRKKRYETAVYERGTTDVACDELVLMAVGSKFSVISKAYHDDLRAALSNIKILRFAIDKNAITAADYRNRFSESVALISSGLAILGKESTMARRFIMLGSLRGAANRMGLCRDIGGTITSDGFVRDEDVSVAFNRNCVEDFRRYFRDFRALASRVAKTQYDRFMNSSDAQAALALIATFDAAAVGATANISADDYFDTITPALLLLDDMSYKVADQINAATEENSIFVGEVLKLVITVGVSLVGVAFVARAQRQSSAKIEFALDRTKKTALAVQAFVPRSFMRLMSLESILSIERGDQTLVAVTMLFCDIRNFTSISETMSNEQLFDWLQAHLQSMTQATEKHHGFVSNFIGDAVSSIFLAASDAVKCAIRMQSVTDSLCYQLVAQNSDHMVRIGVGIHHATVGVGIMGNDKHHSCAIVSAEVNVAAQLEALTKEYGARIIVTAEAFDQLGPGAFEARPLGRVLLSTDAKRDYTLYDVFQSDLPETKEYKERTLGQWEAVLSYQECHRFAEADALLDEMAHTALKLVVKDSALAVKRGKMTPHDQFDL